MLKPNTYVTLDFSKSRKTVYPTSGLGTHTCLSEVPCKKGTNTSMDSEVLIKITILPF